MIPKQDPATCLHHIDMNSLIVDQIQTSPTLGGGRRIRLSTECHQCRSIVTLDEVFEKMMQMIQSLGGALARLEATVYGVGASPVKKSLELADEPVLENCP